MKFPCKKCGAMNTINPAAEMGAKGGKAKGKSKARTSEQARKAALIGWRKRRLTKTENKKVLKFIGKGPIAEPWDEKP